MLSIVISFTITYLQHVKQVKGIYNIKPICFIFGERLIFLNESKAVLTNVNIRGIKISKISIEAPCFRKNLSEVAQFCVDL